MVEFAIKVTQHWFWYHATWAFCKMRLHRILPGVLDRLASRALLVNGKQLRKQR